MHFRYISTGPRESVAIYQSQTTNWPWSPVIRAKLGRLVWQHVRPTSSPGDYDLVSSRIDDLIHEMKRADIT
jgi:hypothetical protein